MLCPTCDTPIDARTAECHTCRTPVGAPVLHPDARVRPVRGVGRAAAVAVGAVVLTYLLTVLILPVQASIATEAGRDQDEELLFTGMLLELAVAVPYLLALLAAVVLVIIWTWRVRKNLDAFPGAGGTLAPGWAIAGWLVPIANLFVPYRVVANVARDSLRQLVTPVLVKVWWAAWLVFQIGERFAARATDREAAALPETLRSGADYEAYADYYASALGANLVPAVACLVAGASLIVLMVRISAAQEARIARGRPSGPILPGSVVAAPPAPGVAGGTIGA